MSAPDIDPLGWSAVVTLVRGFVGNGNVASVLGPHDGLGDRAAGADP